MAEVGAAELFPFELVIDGESIYTRRGYETEREIIEAIPGFVHDALAMGEALHRLGAFKASSNVAVYPNIHGDPLLERSLRAEMVRCADDFHFNRAWGDRECPILSAFLERRASR